MESGDRALPQLSPSIPLIPVMGFLWLVWTHQEWADADLWNPF